jgi:hypothetical protein
MCPMCLMGSLWLWLGAASSGGVVAFVVRKLRARRLQADSAGALNDESASS